MRPLGVSGMHLELQWFSASQARVSGRHQPIATLVLRLVAGLLVAGLLVAGLLGACSSGPSRMTMNADAGSQDGQSDATTGKNLKIISLTPARGPLEGGQQVDIAGTAFDPGATVWFDDVAADVTYRAGTTHLFVMPPPHAMPGAVDVTVRNSDNQQAKLVKGFLYLGAVSVDTFAPTEGPNSGGTQITVHGSGFHAGDRVLIGQVEAMGTTLLAPDTLVALTPARPMKDADQEKVAVSVRTVSGLFNAQASFTYGLKPTVWAVSPSVVPTAGATVTLHGQALGNADTLYAHGAKAELAAGTASTVRGASLPGLHAIDSKAVPGPADLLIAGPFGASKLSPAFAYADTGDVAKLYGVTPPTGSATGNTTIAMIVSLPAGAQVTAVRLDGQTATNLQQADGLVTVQTPAHKAGPVAVAIDTTAGSTSLDAAFTYVGPIVVSSATPASGPTAGGTAITLAGSGFSANCQVRIGMYSAIVQKASAGGSSLTVSSPPGAPGSADIAVTCQGVQSDLPNGFSYTDGELHVNAADPSSGATSGGTLLTIYGAGFAPTAQVQLDGKPCKSIKFLSTSELQCLAPAHQAGAVPLTVVQGKQAETLVDGYTYASPSSDDGGTSGSTAKGTLNVAVLDIYTLSPIEDAYVQVGQPGAAIFPKYNGNTDASGQIVFNGNDLTAPLTVSASKPDYSASSIVSFDARNATLLLFPETPPSSGGGAGGPTPVPLTILQGKVLDEDKYLLVPPNNCLKSEAFGNGDLTCDPCKLPTDCTGVAQSGATYQCVSSGIAGSLCMPDCTAKDICPNGYGCYVVPENPAIRVCKPQLGIRRILCSTSMRAWDDTENPKPGANMVQGAGALPWPSVPVDEATGQFQISSRPDELAIECIGGYISNATQEFIPTAMGIRRHVFPQPGQPALTGLDIRLNIPLRRTLQLRLDAPEHTFGGQWGNEYVTPWIDLGSDGLAPLPTFTSLASGSDAVVDKVPLAYQPVQLPQELSETHYVYYARVEYGGDAETTLEANGPVTATLHSDIVAPGDTNWRLRAVDGTSQDSALGINQTLSGVVAGADGQILFAERGGHVYRGQLEALSLIWQAPIIDPQAVVPAVLAVAGTPSDATIVGQKGTVRRVTAEAVTPESLGTTSDLTAVCVGQGHRVIGSATGELWSDEGTGWQSRIGVGATAVTGLWCTAQGALAVTAQGQIISVNLQTTPENYKTVHQAKAPLRCITEDGSGGLWAGGDVELGLGALLLTVDAQGDWASGWPQGVAPAKMAAIDGLAPSVGGGLLLLSRDGAITRLDAAGLQDESPERRDIHWSSGALMPDGRSVLVGEPGLWLGPFLTVPTIASPDQVSSGGQVSCQWSEAPGPDASFTRIHIDGSGFPFWWAYVDAADTTVQLPDFQSLAGFKVFLKSASISYEIHVDRGYIPAFSINGFSTYQLEFGDPWRSWAKNYKTIQ